MISRRELLAGTVGFGLSAFRSGAEPLRASASQPGTPVTFDVPEGACDCQTHVFGDPARFPFFAGRSYTPEPASVEELRALHKALRVGRVVVVQPSVYGTDNSCVLDAVRQLGAGARGIAVIDDKTPDSALDDMDRAGVRGIRLNLETGGVTDPAAARQRFADGVARVRGRGWHVQIYARVSLIESLVYLVQDCPVPVVFDHFGGVQASLGPRQAGFPALVGLVRGGNAYVKLSAPDHCSTQAPTYPDIAPFVQLLLSTNPERLLWGTNWPHPDSSQVAGRKATDIAPLKRVDEGLVFNLFAGWVKDPAQRRKILVDNPARLYGF
jgi:predicted TIM-barrel fold metal-dependent hydrolase